MNILFLLEIFQIFTIICGSIQVFKPPDYLLLSQAASEIISEFSRNQDFLNVRINMAISSNANHHQIKDVGNEILRNIGTKIKALIKESRDDDKIQDKRRSPIVLIIDSIEAFNTIKDKIEHDMAKYYLVILTKGIFKEIDQVLLTFWKVLMVDVNFLVMENHQVSMFTYFPFEYENCGSNLELQLINTFDAKTQTWSSSEIYPEKVQDLKNCTLKIGVMENEPLVIVEKGKDDSKAYRGIEVQLIRELGNEFNFFPTFFGPFNKIGSIFDNGTSDGLLGSVYQGELDVAIGTLSLQLERTNFLSATSFYSSIPLVLVIPPTQSISPFEKLYLPFDLTTWCLLVSIFVLAYIVIIASKCLSKTLYNLIVGNKVNFPFTNMMIAFLGSSQSQSTLPKSNFPRFLLAKFLLFCLVLRGLYQGKLFDIMQMDINEKEPRTIDDLIDSNVIFYTYESLSRRVSGFKFTKK